jgi:hypothetical protein
MYVYIEPGVSLMVILSYSNLPDTPRDWNWPSYVTKNIPMLIFPPEDTTKNQVLGKLMRVGVVEVLLKTY